MKRKYLFILLAIGLSGVSVQAQTFYVRAGASGNGTDWNNAYGTLPGSLQRGATYYMADGAYGDYTFDDAASGTTLITVKKATVVDHGTDTGWSNAYGDGEAAFGSWNFTSGYWLVDGNGALGTYGFLLNGDTIYKVKGHSPNNVTIKSVKLDSTGQTGGKNGFDVRGDNWTVSNLECVNTPGDPFTWDGTANLLAEYVYVNKRGNSAGTHADAMVFRNTGSGNVVRYCRIDWNGQQIFYDGTPPMINGTTTFYGNVFYGGPTSGKGFHAQSLNPTLHVNFYNNTFVNVLQSINLGANGTAVSYNNIFYDTGAPDLGDTHNYNWFETGMSTQGEANAQTGGNPFVNYAGNNYRLVAATLPGKSDLGALYNPDMDAAIRGSDGAWDRGAFEFRSGPDTVPPVISAVQAQTIGTTIATIVWLTDEVTTSIIQYGPTTNYANSVTNTALVASHAINLTGLTAGTLYHYRVRSADATGNLRTSGDFTFTTLVPDLTPPTATLTAPQSSSTVSNVITLTASASDIGSGVESVTFLVDGVAIGSDTTSPYSFSWNTRSVSNGAHVIRARATDLANLQTDSAAVTVNVFNTGTPLLDGLVGYWRFDDGAGTTAQDASGNGNTGTLITGATWSTGRVGGAVLFNGTAGYVRVPSTSALEQITNAVTICAWVRIDPNGNMQTVARKVLDENNNPAPFSAYDLIVEETAGSFRPRMGVTRAGSTTRGTVYGSAHAYGAWYHVAGVYNGTTLRIYVNGVEEGNAPFTGAILQTAQPLCIGRYGAVAESVRGTIDEFRLYSRALPLEEIQVLANSNRPNQPAGFRVVQN